MKDGKFYMYGNRRNSNVINVHLSQAFPFFDTTKVNKKMIDSISNCYCNEVVKLLFLIYYNQ